MRQCTAAYLCTVVARSVPEQPDIMLDSHLIDAKKHSLFFFFLSVMICYLLAPLPDIATALHGTLLQAAMQLIPARLWPAAD